LGVFIARIEAKRKGQKGGESGEQFDTGVERIHERNLLTLRGEKIMMKKVCIPSFLLLMMSFVMPWAIPHTFAAKLTPKDCRKAIDQAVQQAMDEDSAFRPGDSTQMHIYCVNREGTILGSLSMEDAWTGSIDIAKAKAYTAAAFSSNENALTSRDIGVASQPGWPLWQIGNSNDPNTPGRIRERGIIEFPGGVPLYKDNELVGGCGVSGDGVDQDEDVAEACSCGFLPPEGIRSDVAALGGGILPYTLGDPTQFDFRGGDAGIEDCTKFD
jgi:uncharacterized protein GlcG (DUF336 family)